MSPEVRKVVIRWFVEEVLNTGNVAAVDELFAALSYRWVEALARWLAAPQSTSSTRSPTCVPVARAVLRARA